MIGGRAVQNKLANSVFVTSVIRENINGYFESEGEYGL